MSGELEPHRDHVPAENSATGGEIPRSWVYWSISIGLALALLIMLAAEVIPLPHHVHHLDITDAFNIAWKIALLPPGVVTARIAIDRINLSKREHEHAVQVARSTELDATQRRITELSAKASDQLGSDKATVRIGGLTDLERLGQNNPDLRQTVIDRICAYLQMPYTMPAPRPAQNEDAQARTTPDNQPTAPQDDDPELRQETKVRLTAQRILIRHTRWPREDAEPRESFWPNITLDLSDATLIDFDMSGCRIVTADFATAVFRGNTRLLGMSIDERANFVAATFGGDASFRGTTFGGDAYFRGTTFRGDAYFSDTTISGDADFHGTTISGDAYFRRTTISGTAFLSDMALSGNALLSDMTISANASFRGTTFNGNAYFHGTTISGHADFSGTTINGNAHLGDTTFNGNAYFHGTTFNGEAYFRGTTFNGDAGFSGTTISGATYFGDSTRAPAVDATLLTVDAVSRHLTARARSAPPDAAPSPA